jgi:hypothetical protein
MRRGLRAYGHTQFVRSDLQLRRRLERGMKQSPTFLVDPGIMILKQRKKGVRNRY